jgi:hypothetical protein
MGVTGEEYLKLKESFENKALGFRDFIYMPNLKILSCCLSDTNAVSRIDSYFTNYRLPWESKTENKGLAFSVGLFEVYSLKNEEKLRFQQAFNVSYNTQAYCMAFNELLNLFAIGCDDGSIHFYQFDKQKRPFHKILFEEKIHNKRITQIAIDGLKGFTYSASEDGYIQVFDNNRKSIVGSTLTSLLRLQGKAPKHAIHISGEEIDCHRQLRHHSLHRPYSSRINRFLQRKLVASLLKARGRSEPSWLTRPRTFCTRPATRTVAFTHTASAIT